MDSAGLRQALGYVTSLGDAYWPCREKVVEKWADLDPAGAMSWATKNSPNSVKNILGNWAAKDPDAAIAWANAEGGAIVDGNPYYEKIIENLPPGPDRIDKATRLMLAQPLGREANGALLATLNYLDEEGTDITLKWLGNLPDDRKDQAISASVLELAGRDPEKTLDWLQVPDSNGPSQICHFLTR